MTIVRERKSFGYYSKSEHEAALKNQFLDLIDEIYEARRKQRCSEVSSRLKELEKQINLVSGGPVINKVAQDSLDLIRDLIEEIGFLKEELEGYQMAETINSYCKER